METARSGELASAFIWESNGTTLGRTSFEGLFAIRKKIDGVWKRRIVHEQVKEISEPSPVHSCQMVEAGDAPMYLKRPFINSGYLVGGTPLEAAYNTLFGLNNETLNAYTMLPGCVIAIAGVLMARAHLPSELAVFWIFLLSALPHAPFAMRLHLTIGCSEATRNLWRTLDIFFIFTCAVPRAAALGWYVFGWRRYAAFMSLAATIYAWNLVSCMLLRRIKDIPKASLPKAVALAILCYTAPVLVAGVQEAQEGGEGWLLRLYCATVALAVVAGVAFGCKVPERWAPGVFDLIGNGHQLMHVAVAVEYGLELWFLWHMACRKVAAGQSVAEQDTLISRLLNEGMAAR